MQAKKSRLKKPFAQVKRKEKIYLAPIFFKNALDNSGHFKVYFIWGFVFLNLKKE
jgi:hypothetical protein